MALTLTYYDSYLKPLITEERETRALADIDRIATFPDEWRNKLGVLRAYVITCLEDIAESEDVFSVKLSQYRKEFDATLLQAKAAINVAALAPAFPLSIPIERG